MKKEISLKIIYWLSLFGSLFSGYLSFNELFQGICVLGSCPVVAGLPACVYGFFMFVIILIMAFLGLYNRGK